MRLTRKSAWFLSLAVTAPAWAAISDLRLQGRTATQAVVAYTAPDSVPCTLEVSTSDQFDTLVHDVNPALFPDANLDNRAGSISSGRERVVVIGRRMAEKARDGRRYSRALQTATRHWIRVTCSDDQQTLDFETTNIPLGMTWNDPLPVDPSQPGEYAWPSFVMNHRQERVIDPKTGMLVRRLSLPTDAFDVSNGSFRDAFDSAGSWRNPAGVLANDATAATFSGNSSGWLMLHAGLNTYLGAQHSYPAASINWMKIAINGWCSGSSCASASDEDRTIQACLTFDGTQCASRMLEAVLLPCSGGCTNDRFRFVLGDDETPVMAAWQEPGQSLGFDYADFQLRSGTVNRRGLEVTLVSGHRFNVKWRTGSRIRLGSQMLTIQRVNSEQSLTLQNAPGGNDDNVAYEGPNTGVLIRKKTASTDEISIQHASWSYGMGGTLLWDAAGDLVEFTNCSGALTPGPNGEPGWHCAVGGSLYWIGRDSGDVSHLGRSRLPGRDGVDGWTGNGFCFSYNGGGPLFDRNDANSFYCGQPDSQGGIALLKATYRGDNTDSGATGSGQPLTECRGDRTTNCWTFENLTPVSRGLSLNQQIAAIQPDFVGFPAAQLAIVGYVGDGNRLQLQIRRDNSNNDWLGFMGVFDLDARRVVAAAPSWKYWPLRWSTMHGWGQTGSADWLMFPATTFRGPYTGRDNFAGNGPYYSRITSGAVPVTGSNCPARPADSPIPASDWPSGNRCITVTVDGEPGDPTPAFYDQGTISSEGTNINLQGGQWTRALDGMQMRVQDAWYTFRYVSPTRGTVSPAPPAWTNVAYAIFREPVNNPKTANPLFAYLQDAEVRDVFCAANDLRFAGGVGNGCGLYVQTEYFRLIIKNGREWVLQRGYPGTTLIRNVEKPLEPNAYLIVVPTSCAFDPTFPCARSSAYWRFGTDARGRNEGNSILVDRTEEGAGHTSSDTRMTVYSIADRCPPTEGLGYNCYNSRVGPMPQRLSSPNLVISSAPAFAGAIGWSVGNIVDSHPSSPHFLAPESEQGWFLDARPFLGFDFVNPANASGRRVTGNLWRFSSSQVTRFRPRRLPQFASCGVSPLVDVSGPNSRLSGDAADSFLYCAALNAGECQPNSAAGDVFVNCPFVSTPYCSYPGIGGADADVQDICLGDNSSHAQGLTQVGYREPDMTGKTSRILSYGFSRYRWFDQFWNTKTTPDGKWLLFRTPWLDGQRHEVLLGLIPPFPALDDVNRADYQRLRLPVPALDVPGLDNAVLEFGYSPDLFCVSRQEVCVKGADASWAFASERVRGTPCIGGCEIELPALPQRVVYYRIVYRDTNNQVIRRTELNAWGVSSLAGQP
jgi:hypothetical protein